MQAREIIAALAKDKGVEKMTALVRPRLNADAAADLAQFVYLYLLEKDTAFVERAYAEGWFGWWVFGVVKKNALPEGQWSREYHRLSRRATEIGEDILERADE